MKGEKKMEIIKTDKGAAPQAPYSQGMISGDFIFTAGQIALVPETGECAGETMAEQADQVCRNIQTILEAAGSSCEKVVKATCYLTDVSMFGEFNEVYAKYFTGRPARTCIQVAALPLEGYLCEVEVIAEK